MHGEGGRFWKKSLQSFTQTCSLCMFVFVEQDKFRTGEKEIFKM